MTTLTDPSFAAPLAELGNRLQGSVLLPSDPQYAGLATGWNLAVPATPIAVLAVATAEDVQQAMRFAAAQGLTVSVQCTGHGTWRATGPDLMVHTGRLDELQMLPDGTLRIGAGVRWQQVLTMLAPLGLTAPAGSAPGVGVVGYLTGGGLGPLGHSLGWGCDYVTAFEVVTGDGELRRATATQNPDLYWALRGGKGMLGIVTAVELTPIRMPELLAGCLYFDGAEAATVAHAWLRWSADLPPEATTSLALLRLPPLPTVPPPLAGRLSVAVRYGWTGDPATGRQALERFVPGVPAVLGGVGPLPLDALGSVHADPVDPMPARDASALLGKLPADGLDAILELAGPTADCPQTVVELRALGGAWAEPPQQPSALCHRDAAFCLFATGLGAPPVVQAVADHQTSLLSAVDAWAVGAQPNFVVPDHPDQLARCYDRATIRRLADLAARYDPSDVVTAARAIRTAG